jgi:hypothetical protein
VKSYEDGTVPDPPSSSIDPSLAVLPKGGHILVFYLKEIFNIPKPFNTHTLITIKQKQKKKITPA